MAWPISPLLGVFATNDAIANDNVPRDDASEEAGHEYRDANVPIAPTFFRTSSLAPLLDYSFEPVRTDAGNATDSDYASLVVFAKRALK